MTNKTETPQYRTALITGAARRLGKAIALSLARRGIDIVVHYHSSRQPAEVLCDEIRKLGRRAWPLPADLTDQTDTAELFDRAVAQAGPIHILVNNASTFGAETLWEISQQSLAHNMAIHALAPLVLSRRFAEQKIGGHIINLLDTRVLSCDNKHAAYHLSKRSLLTLTRMLAVELAPDIRVNGIAPGLILPPEGRDESYLHKLAHTTPLNTHGCEQDITDAAIFLINSRFITGQVIYVDGGTHMKGRMYE